MTDHRIRLDEANRLAETNEHTAAVDLALSALEANPPYDIFIDLHERITISGFYSSKAEHKNAAKLSCDIIASDRRQGWHRKNLARQNFTWYANSLKELAPSTQYTHVDFTAPFNYKSTNPSLATFQNQLWMIQRTVNYVIRADGSYDMRGDSAIRTANYLMQLNSDLMPIICEPILPPDDMPTPLYNLVIGFEDSRLFFWKGEPWCTSTVRELTPDGWCEIVLAKISQGENGKRKLTDWRVIKPRFCDKQHEKNWMPLVFADKLFFVYSSDPVRIIDENGNLVSEIQTSIAADSYRGGGTLAHFDNGYLSLIHESTGMTDGRRRYLHRFAWYDVYGRLAKRSEAFYIKKLGIEFSPGIAVHPTRDSIVIGFGLEDCESWLAEVSADDVRSMLEPAGLDKKLLASDPETMHSVLTEVNRALDTSNTVAKFRDIAMKSGLPLHEDVQKNWDSVLATYWTTLTCSTTDPVMDVAATPGSAYLPGLRRLGYTDLVSINLTQKETEVIDGISYQYGDCTGTLFPDNYFGFISCLSVIEHGVDVEKFLRESYRILKNNGYLFVSTDYWQDPVDTYGQMAFGSPVKVFDRPDIERLIKLAKDIGFTITSTPHLECHERTVEWIGMNYTFLNLMFKKKI